MTMSRSVYTATASSDLVATTASSLLPSPQVPSAFSNWGQRRETFTTLPYFFSIKKLAIPNLEFRHFCEIALRQTIFPKKFLSKCAFFTDLECSLLVPLFPAAIGHVSHVTCHMSRVTFLQNYFVAYVSALTLNLLTFYNIGAWNAEQPGSRLKERFSSGFQNSMV
jgi:hypothetical protein